MLHSQDHKEQIMDMRKQRLILKAQKEERKKKAEENHAEELEINRMKIEMEREQQKARQHLCNIAQLVIGISSSHDRNLGISIAQ